MGEASCFSGLTVCMQVDACSMQSAVEMHGPGLLLLLRCRTMKFAHCGTASSIYFAVQQAGKDMA
jgi:hypothetical protein